MLSCWFLLLVISLLTVTEAVIVDDRFYDELSVVLRYDGRDNPQEGDPIDANVETMVITIAIFPDLFIEDIGFIFSSTQGEVIAQKPAGFLTVKERVYTTTVNVNIGEVYNLTVLDKFGDGLKKPGFYAVYYGYVGGKEEILRQDGFVGKSSTTLFSAQRPSTAAPSSSPQPSMSPFPTHSPTACLPENDDAWKIVNTTLARTVRPQFKTSDAIYGFDLCVKHTSYVDCTNEQGQDCQWQFLGDSMKKGVCRIDPISACIGNGNCKCDTTDFRGGPATMGQGLMFHAPISVTARDIGPYKVTFRETYTPPSPQSQNTKHPQDIDFFISKVDFTARTLSYDVPLGYTPIPLATDVTIAMKLHYLYWDMPMAGVIWTGVGHSIRIDADDGGNGSITINGYMYAFPVPLKKWTCTSIAITKTQVYVGRTIISRNLIAEVSPKLETQITLGPFSGELFDVRIYQGPLSWNEVRLLGARCTAPDDPAALEYRRDIENPYYMYGCRPDFLRLPVDEGGRAPTTGEQTYGSGPFATLWLKPNQNPFKPSEYVDVSEGEFDPEHYFQQAKVQAYLWEVFLFHTDMIAFNQEPYRRFESANHVPRWSAKYWNNPCRYIHNFNNGWQFPIYESSFPKWTANENGNKAAVFDLGALYRTRADWASMAFVAHEMYHGMQGHIGDVYLSSVSRWLLESTAEFGASITFPGARKIIAPLAMAPSFPLGFTEKRDSTRSSHFMNQRVSINKWVRGGHVYAGWILWWFLSQHAGLPHAVGHMYSNWYQKRTYTAGEIFYLREVVENANLDFGDVWATCIAHMRTWDFPSGERYKVMEQEDFDSYFTNPDIVPPLSRNITMEGRKTTVEIDPKFGTRGQMVKGPSGLRPGPNGWNCLTIRGVADGNYVTIQLKWDDGLGFDSGIRPAFLPNLHADCDRDPRFYNSVVVVHNEKTGKRRYWKLKGKAPPRLGIAVGNEGSVTIHILMVPTPPADYVSGQSKANDGSDVMVQPIPIYSYNYSVLITTNNQLNADVVRPEAKMAFGIMQFDKATPGWWPMKCTCLEPPDVKGSRCMNPIFFSDTGSEPPSVSQLTPKPSISPATFLDVSNAPSSSPLQILSNTPSDVVLNAPSRNPATSPSAVPITNGTSPPTTIGQPVTNAPSLPPTFVICFSGASTVHVKGRGSVSIRNLTLGEQVMVGEGAFHTVYSFGHRNELTAGLYLQIYSDKASHPLEISPDHMVFVSGGRAVPASSIQVGDQLETGIIDTLSTVYAIETVLREGAYAPFTITGTVIVDGIKASSYVSFQDSPVLEFGGFSTTLSYHWMAHAFLLPHRLYCEYVSSCRQESYDGEGMSTWISLPHLAVQWLLTQHILVRVLVLIPTVPLLFVFSLFDWFLS